MSRWRNPAHQIARDAKTLMLKGARTVSSVKAADLSPLLDLR